MGAEEEKSEESEDREMIFGEIEEEAWKAEVEKNWKKVKSAGNEEEDLDPLEEHLS